MTKGIRRILALCLVFSLFFSITGISPPAQAGAAADLLRVMDQTGDDLLYPLTAYSGSGDESNRNYSLTGSPVDLTYFSDINDLLTIIEENDGVNTAYRMWITSNEMIDYEAAGGKTYALVYRPDVVTGDYLDVFLNAPSGEGKFLLNTNLDNGSWWDDNFILSDFEMKAGDVLSLDRDTTKGNLNFDYSGQESDNTWTIDFRYIPSYGDDTTLGGIPYFALQLDSSPAKNIVETSLSVQDEDREAAVLAPVNTPQNEYYFRPDNYVWIDYDIYDAAGTQMYYIYKNGQVVRPQMEVLDDNGASMGILEYDYNNRSFVWEMPEGDVNNQYTLRITQDTGSYAGVVTQDLTLLPDSQSPVVSLDEPGEDEQGNIIISGTVTDDENLSYVRIGLDERYYSWWSDEAIRPRFVDPNLTVLDDTYFSDDDRQFNFSIKHNNPADGNHEIKVDARDQAGNQTEDISWFNYPQSSQSILSVSPANEAIIIDNMASIEAVVDLPIDNIDAVLTEMNIQGGRFGSGNVTPAASSNADGTTTLTYTPGSSWIYDNAQSEIEVELHLVDVSGNDYYHTWRFTVDNRAPYINLESANMVGEDSRPLPYLRAGEGELIYSANEKLDLNKSKFYVVPGAGRLPRSIDAQAAVPPEFSADAQEISLKYYYEHDRGYYYKAPYQVTESAPDGPAAVFCTVYDLQGNLRDDSDSFFIDTTPPVITNALLMPAGGGLPGGMIPFGLPVAAPALPDKSYVNNETHLELVVENKVYNTDASLYQGTGDFSSLSAEYTEPLKLTAESRWLDSLGLDRSVQEAAYTYRSVTMNIDGGYIQADLPSSQDGEKIFTLELSDMAGNKTAATDTVVVDNTSPRMDLAVESLADNKLKLTVKVSEELLESEVQAERVAPPMPWIYAGPLTEAEAGTWPNETYMGQKYGTVPVNWSVYDNNTYVGIVDDPGKPQMAAVAVDKAKNEGVAAYCTYNFNAAEGIEINLPDGTSLNIPAGAVTLDEPAAAGAATDTSITIKAVLPQTVTLDDFVAGGSIDIMLNGQKHYQFAKPVTITMPENLKGLAGKTSLAYYDEADGSWELLETNRTVNGSGVFLSTQVNHFSQFAALADVTPPEITVESPTNNTTSTSGSITVKGITEAGLAVIIANGAATQTVTADSSGSFEATVAIALGTNTIKISAFDWAGNKAEETVTVTGNPSGSGSSTSDGPPQAGDDTDEVGNDADKVENVVADPNASEDDITKAADKVSDSFNNSADNLNSSADVDNLADMAVKVTDAINQAAGKVQSEEAAAKVTVNAVKVTEALAKTAGKATTSAAKQKLADSAVSSLDAIQKSSDKITTAAKAAEAARSQAKAITNIKSIIEGNDQAKSSTKVVEKTASVLDSTVKLMDKVTDAEEAASVAEDIIESVGALTKSVKAHSVTDNKLQRAARRAEAKVVRVVEKAIEKAGTEQITSDEIEVSGAKAKAWVNLERIAGKAAALEEKVNKLTSKLDEGGIGTRRKLAKKVSVAVSTVEGTNEVETELPGEIFDTISKNGIDRIEIKSGTADFGISNNTFGNRKGQNISLGARNTTREELPARAQTYVPEDGTIVDLNAAVGGEAVSRFNEPMEVAIPYTLKEGENPNFVTVFLVRDDGLVEPVGGKYDPVTGRVRFITNHFSKYFAKPSVQEFNDLSNYSWAEEQVEMLAGKGIITGRKTDSFDPAAKITRAEFATLIAKMLKLDGSAGDSPFNDVAADAWYADEVAAVYAEGLVAGKRPDTFEPDGRITRAEMATIIAKVLAKQGYTESQKTELAVFIDADKVAPWAQAGVAMAAREEIVSGMGDGSFAPQAAANRAQAAVMLYRLFIK